VDAILALATAAQELEENPAAIPSQYIDDPSKLFLVLAIKASPLVTNINTGTNCSGLVLPTTILSSLSRLARPR
jgi:hypothetical protein